MKEFIKNIPLVGKVLTSLVRLVKRGDGFPGSLKYWEERYAKGGTSGSGSYGRLAHFKAKILNDFVRDESIQSVVEFGCGDGHQLTLADYPRYIGLDVSKTAIQWCREKFKDDKTKQFKVYKSGSRESLPKAELTLSLDVIYHLIEDSVFETYMRDLFHCASRYVIVYASNSEGEQRHHERKREFSKWVAREEKTWRLLKKIPNDFPYDINHPDETSQSDFFIYQKM